ncbi:nucleotide sugar dehydrogenase [Thauera linaloolentis]|uniref:Nucleotide sugar dehydrogenase n=1 Tax=Thauera linaloolentis (strain DSM 12138 / JCM 21573 / CCUG 41526 / CIP 105981 / IAM 15112 / NBRC 102519 / 47Lol) TaxID=1123367 RepID=N6Z5E4_THAL4|nr:nucleotide sugar dehydrogenase [Thauera linaloolentis]ENO89782.1 nucleotide sugar dehydrogenase [Thauera linaloolentis 47Lol = DSM 12138]MCM8567029.1 nucleotide sugar dehydrogenase [Thauera linaloolentis]
MTTIAVIGLGYVGLPLAVEFGKKYKTLGFDLSAEKVAAYRDFIDPTGEVATEDLRAAVHLSCHTDPAVLKEADFIVVAVPTPVDEAHQPDFTPLVKSSETVGRHLKRGAIVVYESTVYPGATEEVCIPILERESGLAWKEGFFVGYSPERINPGDKERTVTKIVKVVSGDTPATLETVTEIYGSVITAGVYPASSIKVAEAAKVIENTQRDLNIALMNELAVIFHRIGIDTVEVLKAAGTKWNFLPFRPGLVGGHCIGVDPYYLTHKADMLGYHPQVILAGRRINDGMGKYVAEQTVKQMIGAGSSIKGADVIVLGLTFKENCPDLRNSKVIDVIRELQSYGCTVHVHDPVAESAEAEHEYGVRLSTWEALPKAQAIVAAVAHQAYLDMPLADLLQKLSSGGVFSDVKSAYDPAALAAEGATVWRL